MRPAVIKSERRCFAYCGDDQCDCGAAYDVIVTDVSASFKAELQRIMKRREPSEEDLKTLVGGPKLLPGVRDHIEGRRT